MAKFYTPQQKELAMTRARMYGSRRAAIQTGIPVETIREWIGEKIPGKKEKKKMAKVVYTDEQKAAALEKVPELGIHGAAKEVGIPWQTVTKWAAEAGLSDARKKAGKAVQKAKDQAVATEIEAKKKTRGAGRKAKQVLDDAAATVSEQAAISSVEVKKTASKAERAVRQKASDAAARIEDSLILNIVIQSENGHAISTKEIVGLVPDGTSDVYVKAEEGKLYWVDKDGATGSVNLW